MNENQAPGSGQKQPEDNSGFAMMAMMMACCMAVVLLFLLIPFVGWPIGLAIGAIGLVAMIAAHQKFMGGHH